MQYSMRAHKWYSTLCHITVVLVTKIVLTVLIGTYSTDRYLRSPVAGTAGARVSRSASQSCFRWDGSDCCISPLTGDRGVFSRQVPS